MGEWLNEWVGEYGSPCLKDSLLYPNHAEACNSALSIYYRCQWPFPPCYPGASLMAFAIPVSQDTIKSFSPATVPPPQVLALGPWLGEWPGCLPEIWTFFREKHRWPISLIQALSKEWLYHSHPQPQANGVKANGEALPAQRSSWEGRKGKVLQVPPLKFAGRNIDRAFSGGSVGYRDTKMCKERLPYSTHHSGSNSTHPSHLLTTLKLGWEKNGKTTKYSLINNRLSKLYM